MGPHFLLAFGTELGRTRSLRINNADAAVTDSMMRDAMDTMIATQAVEGAGGRIQYPRGATLIETIITPINLS